MSRKRIEPIYLDCLAFAVVFLRANYTGATALHMALSNHGISFNISLWLMIHGIKSVYFLLENLSSSLNCLKHPKKNRPGPILRKSIVEIGRLDLKTQFIPYKNLFCNKCYGDSDRYSNILSGETIRFWKLSVVLELYAKMYVEMAKSRLPKKCYNFGANEDFPMKIQNDNFRASIYDM